MDEQDGARLDVINAVLVRLGVDPLVSIPADSTDFTIISVRSAWREVVLAAFGERTWTFASRYVKLVRLADAPVGKWEFAYALPNDFQNLNGFYEDVESTRPLTWQFQRVGYAVHTNAESLYLNYTAQIPVSQWPSNFRLMVINQLSVYLVRRLKGDQASELEGALRDSSAQSEGAAISQDIQGQGGNQYRYGSVVRVRHERGGSDFTEGLAGGGRNGRDI